MKTKKDFLEREREDSIKEKERFDKLPAWARNEIERLRANERDYKTKAYEAAHPGLKSNTWIETYATAEPGEDKRLGLPSDSTIVFNIGDAKNERRIQCRVIWRDGHSPSLHASSPDGTLIVKPHASNSIELKVEDR